MADAQITDYTSLSDAIADYLEQNGNTVFTDQIDRFIGLAEVSFNRQILSRRQEVTATLTTDADGVVALPADYIAPRASSTAYSGYSTPLRVIPAGAIAANHPFSTGGDPYDITIKGGSIYVNPVAERDITFDYYAKFVGLSASNATNWVITNHPDYYLNSVLDQACHFLQDWTNKAIYKAEAERIEGEILTLFGLESFNNAGMVLEGTTP